MTGEPESGADWQRTWHDLWEILGCKWTFHVVRVLSMEPEGCGFNEMERRIDGITSTVLARRLDQLETAGLVEKTWAVTSPPSSSYRLTETGAAIADHLREIEQLNPRR